MVAWAAWEAVGAAEGALEGGGVVGAISLALGREEDGVKVA